MHFMGYMRSDGQAGTRNLVAVLPTVFCANHVVRRIADAIPECRAFPHPVGCGYPGPDQQITSHLLKRLCAHPNFGAVLFVGLGCERVRFSELGTEQIALHKPVRYICIQEEGDSIKALKKGIDIASELATNLQRQQRVPCGLEHLVLGLKCGGTDAASGLAANPVLGETSDMLLTQGASALLTEITELCGTEHIMARRARTADVADKIKECVARNVRQLHRATAAAHATIGESMLVSPGNAEGGVSNVVEKALGGLKKAGKGIFQDVIGYADALPARGLYLMDGPGHDGEAVSGLVAAGANVVVFTTGRGTPAGFPGVPVIKATGNPALAKSMCANIDFNAGRIFSEGASLSTLGHELLDTIIRVASGELTKAEALGHEELFCISRYMAEQCICESISEQMNMNTSYTA